MPPLNVADVIGQAQVQNANIEAFKGQLQSVTSGQVEAATQQATNLQKAAEDTAIVTGQEQKGLLAAQQAGQKFAKAAGTDILDPSEIITQLGEQYRQTAIETNKAADQVVKIASDPFMSMLATRAANGKPGAAILQGLLTGGAVGKFNALKQKQETLSEQINQLNTATQETAKTQASIAGTLSAESIKAATDKAFLSAQNLSLAAKQNAAQYNIDGIKTLQQMSQQQLGNSLSAEQLELEASQRAIQQKSLELAIEERAEKVKLQKETDEGLRADVDIVQRGMQILYGGKAPPLPVAKITQMYRENPTQFKEFFTAGLTQVMTGQSIVDNDPGRAAMIYESTNAQVPAEQKKLKDLLSKSLNDARGGVYPGVDEKTGKLIAPTNVHVAGQSVDIKKPEGLASAAGANINYYAQQDARNIDPTNFQNIYQAPDLNSILALKGTGGNQFIEKVLRPQVISGKVNTDFSALTDQAVKAVQAGTINFNDAVSGLNLIAQAAIKINNATMDYKKIGIPEQHSFNTTVEGFSGKTSIDMANYAQVTRQLSLKILRENQAGLPFGVSQ